ncbi:hypothetical protein PR048_016212 [Dryococelus australis]|uniref:Uncharacterized protein n=1 Tax=Dryococelus australis TaxID=614101 RepID=A0ABQ9HJ40_9NEOP|nr:hypothetical protein PR048_016212 [Dryococelus australis]
MRVLLGADVSIEKFANILLKTEDGEYPESEGMIYCSVELLEIIYPNISYISENFMDWLCECAFLTTENDYADVIKVFA